ncbi:uncharacterized protein LOC143446899 [Clavelina lepadiformis]|uniref:uncharacterized protein LOC143446899 n=1 Tax=Clavelina lepadiformis TaxID=159417 RepID=UPI004042B8ED
MSIIGDFDAAIKFLGEDHGSLEMVDHKTHIALPAAYLGQISKAISLILHDDLPHYSSELHGMPVAFNSKKVKLLSSVGQIIGAQSCVHFDVQTDYVVFKPKLGDCLKGVVNERQTKSVSCLIHGYFYASVSCAGSNQGSLRRVNLPSIGDVILFKVCRLEEDGYGYLAINGDYESTLEATNNTLPIDADSGIDADHDIFNRTLSTAEESQPKAPLFPASDPLTSTSEYPLTQPDPLPKDVEDLSDKKNKTKMSKEKKDKKEMRKKEKAKRKEEKRKKKAENKSNRIEVDESESAYLPNPMDEPSATSTQAFVVKEQRHQIQDKTHLKETLNLGEDKEANVHAVSCPVTTSHSSSTLMNDNLEDRSGFNDVDMISSFISQLNDDDDYNLPEVKKKKKVKKEKKEKNKKKQGKSNKVSHSTESEILKFIPEIAERLSPACNIKTESDEINSDKVKRSQKKKRKLNNSSSAMLVDSNTPKKVKTEIIADIVETPSLFESKESERTSFVTLPVLAKIEHDSSANFSFDWLTGSAPISEIKPKKSKKKKKSKDKEKNK